MNTALTDPQIQELPKVMLHDHLDGGLRPATIIELAKEIGYKDLPTYDADDLQSWILDNSKRGNLNYYLEAFDHTIAVMQNPEAIERVAFECGEDMAADGVVYLESRFAPVLFPGGPGGNEKGGGLSLDEIMGAAVRGYEAATSRYDITIHILCCGMKQFDSSEEIAELAISWQDKATTRVVGFDLAGPEDGFLCSAHIDAIKKARDGGLKITLHAGEAAGLESIADAIDPSGAERLGHGVRIMDDITIGKNGKGEEGEEEGGKEIQLGALAQKVFDSQIPLEVCPTSNLHTGVADNFQHHPLKTLFEAGFCTTLNTDNRLMSEITLSQEFANCQQAYNWGMDEFKTLTTSALNAAFCSDAERADILQRLIAPAYS